MTAPTRHAVVVARVVALLMAIAISGHAAAQQTEPPDPGIVLAAELSAGWIWQQRGGETFNEFALDRAELAARFETGETAVLGLHALGELGIEGVRSGGPQSGYGIDGDSIVARMHRAWAGVGLRPADGFGLVLAGGLLEDTWRGAAQPGGSLPPSGRLGTERFGVFDAADLGGELRASALDGGLRLRLSATNGEGLALPEQNAGKNLTAVLEGEVLPNRLHPWSLTLRAVVRHGSLGVGTARNHRYGGGLTLRSPWPSAGFEWIEAWGFSGRSDLRARMWSAWAESHCGTRWIGVAVWADQLDPDLDVGADHTSRFGAAVFSDVALRNEHHGNQLVRAAIGVERDVVGADALVEDRSSRALAATRVFVRLIVDARQRIGGQRSMEP